MCKYLPSEYCIILKFVSLDYEINICMKPSIVCHRKKPTHHVKMAGFVLEKLYTYFNRRNWEKNGRKWILCILLLESLSIQYIFQNILLQFIWFLLVLSNMNSKISYKDTKLLLSHGRLQLPKVPSIPIYSVDQWLTRIGITIFALFMLLCCIKCIIEVYRRCQSIDLNQRNLTCVSHQKLRTVRNYFKQSRSEPTNSSNQKINTHPTYELIHHNNFRISIPQQIPLTSTYIV